MSFASSRCRAVLACLAATAASAAFSGPAFADGSEDAAAAGCPAVGAVQPFGPWQDFADYFLAPDGGFEAGAEDWDLSGGAAAVEGNETYAVGGPDDHRSLSLPAGGSATSASICIGLDHRSMRFFARGSGEGVVHVDAVYAKRSDKEKSVRLATVSAGESWAPSPIVPMRVNEIAPDHDDALPVSLRFTARGEGSWQIDDVYVDPYRKG